MTKKIFDRWNEEKQNLHFASKKISYPHVREIWYTKTGVNIGFEENGKKNFLRPVLILKKVGNLFFIVSLTTKGKDDYYFYHKINTAIFNNQNKKQSHNSYIILSQARVMDIKRFTEKMEFISGKEFIQIKEKLKTVLF
jgi:mRNA interferase MazF